MSETSITLDAEQDMAIMLAMDMSKRLVSITGEAGTGKTTVIKQLTSALDARGTTYRIAAPTGKAARRITEATGREAITIHRMLEFNRPEIDEETGQAKTMSRPSRNSANPLSEQVIIVDEYAMVATSLHRDLVSAIGRGTVLRVLGDVRQLPPIEDKNLADKVSPFSKCLAMPNSITLKNVYRQAEGNGILEAARMINAGRMFGSNNDIKLRLSDTTIVRLRALLDETKDSIDWKSLNNQVIIPARQSEIGTLRINGIMQQRFNPNMIKRTFLPRNKWDKTTVYVAIGDKVVCTTNMYDMRNYEERFTEFTTEGLGLRHTYIPAPDTKQLLNGEVGIIIEIGDDGTLEIDFGDRVVEIPPKVREYSDRNRVFFNYDPRKSIELAYALTTHKCQGSEYENVIYMMANVCFYNLSRANFYTGITRARKHVDVVSDQRALQMSLRKVLA